jgi:hypothetical protein
MFCVLEDRQRRKNVIEPGNAGARSKGFTHETRRAGHRRPPPHGSRAFHPELASPFGPGLTLASHVVGLAEGFRPD